MLSQSSQEPSADAALQFQFTAYLQTALRRQQQRSQAKLDRMRLHESENEAFVDGAEYLLPDDTITLEVARLPLREQKILPVAVGGDVEARHGIVLAKTYPAKKFGVKTGMALWEAKQACPGLIILPPRYDLYLRFSRLLREIAGDYTNLIEPFGLDEFWADVTGTMHTFGSGKEIAEQIQKRVLYELGITVSIGVSYNKIFAKLGSDMNKPHGLSVITPQNYQRLVWKLPASDLLGVGRATEKKLASRGIHIIGDLARTPPELLHGFLHKWGGDSPHVCQWAGQFPRGCCIA